VASHGEGDPPSLIIWKGNRRASGKKRGRSHSSVKTHREKRGRMGGGNLRRHSRGERKGKKGTSRKKGGEICSMRGGRRSIKPTKSFSQGEGKEEPREEKKSRERRFSESRGEKCW